MEESRTSRRARVMRCAARRSLLPVSLLALALACAPASAPPRAPAPQPVITTHAKKLYALAEQRYAARDYVGAAALWRQVFLQLPSDEDGDALRHELVARMAHALTRDYTARGDASSLRAAQGLLERYLAKHEALFGGGPESTRARWELVGLLVDVETALLSHPIRAEVATADASEPATDEGVSSDMLAASSDTPRARARARGRAPAVAGEDGVRVIEVGVPEAPRHELGFIDGPGARAFMLHDGLHGASMFHEPRYLHGPRVLVRLGPPGVSSDADSTRTRREARAQARAAVLALRPAIASCFAQAMGRVPRSWTRVTVDFTMLPDGRLERVRVTDGALLDVDGDLCLLESFEGAHAERPQGSGRIAARVPLTVLYQQAFQIDPSAASAGGGGGGGGGSDALCRGPSSANELNGSIAAGFTCGN
ncbi:MAG: hypothetical protein KC468_00375 [Myxococcales bacterium]|nr:hypothetical protein [Myxococcales bacterium]